MTSHGTRARAVAIIGAGMAGLSCARALLDAQVPVTVFDKGRGPGGRMSTRSGPIAFDHGAQYFTVTDDGFGSQVDAWLRRGVVAEWRGRVVAIDSAGTISASGRRERYVGVPGMNAPALALAQSLDVRCGVTVAPPERRDDAWQLRDVEGSDLGRYDVLVVTAPAAQTAALLTGHPLADLAVQAELAPCLAVMAAWDDNLDLEFDAAFVNCGPLAWVARNGSKPGRHHPNAWVLHAGHGWSTAHVDEPASACVDPLLTAFAEAVGRELPAPSHVAGHRWRYALPIHPLDAPCLWDRTTRVAVAGDWCGGPRLEGAWLSGRAAAHRVLEAG